MVNITFAVVLTSYSDENIDVLDDFIVKSSSYAMLNTGIGGDDIPNSDNDIAFIPMIE